MKENRSGVEEVESRDMATEFAATAGDLQLAKEEAARLKDQLKAVNRTIETAEEKLIQLLIDNELQGFVHDGRSYNLATKTFVNDIAPERERLYQVLKDYGYGDLVNETVHAQTLGAFVREMMDLEAGELPVWLEGLVRVYQKDTISIRKK